MKIRYFSDLHLEFRKLFNPKIIKPGPDEVLILAGDIGKPTLGEFCILFDYLSKNFKKIFYVPGNHEYYSKKNHMGVTQTKIPEVLEKYPNVSVLDCDSEVYDGYHFVGCTMWSLVKNHRYKINDIYSIPGMNIPFYNLINKEEVEYLTETIDSPLSSLPGVIGRIVITHHIPSEKLISPKYNFSDYNEWFFTDMDDVIKRNNDKIVGWWFGHTHTPSETSYLGVNFHCNPIGYPNEDNRDIKDVTQVSLELSSM